MTDDRLEATNKTLCWSLAIDTLNRKWCFNILYSIIQYGYVHGDIDTRK